MNARRRAWTASPVLAAIALVACDDPASLRVSVDIKEPNLGAIEVIVTRDPDMNRVEVLNCKLPAGERAEPGCALEDGTGRWSGDISSDEEDFAFILYGRPRTKLEITVTGRRANGLVATSTSPRFELPEQRGVTEGVKIELQSRTREQMRCPPIAISPDMGDVINDRSGVTAGTIVDGTTEIIATSGPRIAFVQFSRNEFGCSLEQRNEVNTDLPCRIRDNSLVSSSLNVSPPFNKRLVAAQCQNNMADQARIFAISYGDPTGPSAATLTIADVANSNQLSRPVLADLDGDGAREIVFLLNRSGTLTLGRWDPRMSPATAGELPLTGLTPLRSQANFGPIIVRSRATGGREVALIAGYPGGLGVVSGDPPTFSLIHSEARNRIPIMGAAATIAERGDTATIMVANLFANTGLEVAVIDVQGGIFTVADIFDIAMPPERLPSTDVEVRIAIGDVDGSGEPTAVIVHDGHAVLFPLRENAAATTFPVWTQTIVQDVQTVLLTNIDGQDGADIVAFDGAGLVHGVDHRGTALDGWPIQAIQGGALRMFVADLDPDRRRRDLELVNLSLRSLEVISLGPGSYDVEASPWPFPQRDPRATAIHGPNERDPRATPVPAP